MLSAQSPTQQSRAIVAQLQRSQLYRDYEQAFRDTTGLPLSLRPIKTADLPHHGDPLESPFCSLLAQSSPACAACLQLQKKLEEEAHLGPKTFTCFGGFCYSAVPVRVGENLVGLLQTGQILLSPPTPAAFARTTRQLRQLGVEVDWPRLEAAYFQARVITRKHYGSILRLLAIFAQHLAEMSNQLMVTVTPAEGEIPAITRARVFIAGHYAEALSLTRVAQKVNMSAFYFCKKFKKATGLTLTEYLARVRVEQAKGLLLNPHTRISEAAYAVGFRSLSQFNRIFRHITGESPTVYRARIIGPRDAPEPTPQPTHPRAR